MKTKLDVIHAIIGYGLFLLTWELFFKRYFYTRSEKEILEKNRGKGFTARTLALMMVQLFFFSAGCMLWLWYF